METDTQFLQLFLERISFTVQIKEPSIHLKNSDTDNGLNLQEIGSSVYRNTCSSIMLRLSEEQFVKKVLTRNEFIHV